MRTIELTLNLPTDCDIQDRNGSSIGTSCTISIPASELNLELPPGFEDQVGPAAAKIVLEQMNRLIDTQWVTSFLRPS